MLRREVLRGPARRLLAYLFQDLIPRDQQRRALLGAGYYGTANIVRRLFGLLTVPLVTRVVSVETYAWYAMILVGLPVLWTLIDLGTGAATVRFVPATAQPRHRKTTSATYLWGTVVMAVLVAAAGTAAAWAAGAVVPSNLVSPVFIAIATAALMALSQAFREILRAHERHGAASAVMHVRYLVAGGMIVTCVGLGLSARHVTARPHLGTWKRMLAFGLPLAADYLFNYGLSADRYLVRHRGTLAQVAIYHLASAPLALVDLVARSLVNVLEPVLYGLDQTSMPRAFDRLLRSYTLLMVALAGAITFTAPEIVALLGPPEYRSAVRIVPWLAFAAAAGATTRYVGVVSRHAGRTVVNTVASGVELGVALLLVLGVALEQGPTAVAAARFVAACGGLLICSLLTLQVWPLRLPVVRVVLALIPGPLLGSWLAGDLVQPLAGLAQRGLGVAAVLVIAYAVLRPRSAGAPLR
jgi:O-antigen/teichoic acid export membrane protein